jgi:mono/diheme cytochrome c family protein
MQWSASWALTTVLLAGCGGSNVGDQDEPQPEAVAVVIGQAFNAAAAGVQTKVRAGAEVLLSGKESRKGDNDEGVPILRFEWTQLVPGAHPVQLVEKSSHTVSFTAPQVREPTTLGFRLTVFDAKNQSDTADVTVDIEPIPDADRFLEFLAHSEQFAVVAATNAPIAPVADAPEQSQIEFTITVTKLVTFKDRSGVTREKVAIGNPQVVSGGWSQRAGSGGADCDAIVNPRLRFEAPRLDLDDQLADGSGVLTDFMEASDVDTATVYARVEISSAPAVQAGVTPSLCVVGGASTPAAATTASVELEAESLFVDSVLHDTKAEALAYYDTIDAAPAGQKKDTLRRWLTANGFDPDAPDYAADSRAVYLNNYDLGLGRDMYMKTGACDGDASQLPLADRIGRCDVASVVINYPSLESAARHLNAIVAVAMEYSAATNGGERFVKFYSFAPDRRDGEFKRVLSVNLDGRGEKYMPQVCVACHGGVPGGVGTDGRYAGNGNIHAAFLPWDLGSLLFSDTDQSFTGKARYGALRGEYTRPAQEAQFKQLNAGAYLTFADPPGMTGRFALARELVEGWYGGAGLPAATSHDAFVPKGWNTAGLDEAAGTADDNPAAAENIYSDVFARHCRSCHVMHIPNATLGDPRSQALCNADASDDPTGGVGAANQLPIACYHQFANLSSLQDMLSNARMPLARLTLDRLWTQQPGQAMPSGDLLAQHLGMSPADLRPGAVSAVFSLSQRQPDERYRILTVAGIDSASGQEQFNALRGQPLRASDIGSTLPVSFRYSLSKPENSTSVLVNAAAPDAAFTPDRPGVYSLTLDVGGSGPARRVTKQIVVGNRAPTVSAGPFSVRQGETTSFIAAQGLLLNAVDADGDALTASLGASVPGCTSSHAAQIAVQSNGAFSYSHNGDLATSDVFKLVVSDGFDAAETCVTVLIQGAPDTAAPSAPAISSAVAASVGTGANADFRITLTWTVAQDFDQFGNSRPLVGYQVFRRLTASATEAPVGALTTGTTFIDTSPLPNTSYTYRVAAIDGGNNRTFSAPSVRTSHSSYRANINSLWTTSLDLRQTCASSGCHINGGAGQTVGGLRLDQNQAANYLQVLNKVNSGRLPCWPDQSCPPGTDFHTGGQALSSVNDVGREDRFDAFQRISKWIAEGALDN